MKSTDPSTRERQNLKPRQVDDHNRYTRVMGAKRFLSPKPRNKRSDYGPAHWKIITTPGPLREWTSGARVGHGGSRRQPETKPLIA